MYKKFNSHSLTAKLLILIIILYSYVKKTPTRPRSGLNPRRYRSLVGYHRPTHRPTLKLTVSILIPIPGPQPPTRFSHTLKYKFYHYVKQFGEQIITTNGAIKKNQYLYYYYYSMLKLLNSFFQIKL